MSLKSTVTARWAAAKERHIWLRHVLGAWQLMQRNHANQYAAAITYFSFLALFPLVLLAVSITGFVLAAHPATQASLFDHVTRQLPGSFGDTLQTAIQTAIDNRSSIGVIGLFGVLLTGLGWIANLREAIDAVWGKPQAKVSFLKGRLTNLLVLVGLGGGITVSLGLTAVGTSLTDQLLGAVGLDGVPGSTVLLKVLGIAIAAAGDLIIFWWLLIRLPAQDVPERIAWRGALLAAVGFEVLKIVGTYTIASTAHSPTAGPFASVIAVLVWIQLVARLMLFACAWTATLTAEARAARANRIPIDEPAAVADADEDGPVVSPATVGATLVGAGAVAGAIATWAALRPRTGAAAGPPARSA